MAEKGPLAKFNPCHVIGNCVVQRLRTVDLESERSSSLSVCKLSQTSSLLILCLMAPSASFALVRPQSIYHTAATLIFEKYVAIFPVRYISHNKIHHLKMYTFVFDTHNAMAAITI